MPVKLVKDDTAAWGKFLRVFCLEARVDETEAFEIAMELLPRTRSSTIRVRREQRFVMRQDNKGSGGCNQGYAHGRGEGRCPYLLFFCTLLEVKETAVRIHVPRINILEKSRAKKEKKGGVERITCDGAGPSFYGLWR